jgi:DNA-binding response OmpR family regulator
MKVVVYSHDADTRAQVRLAIGKRPAPDVPQVEIIEVATHPALVRLLDAGGADVMVLDGEAQPSGGMGVCRQAKDEVFDCPPVLLIIGRPDDGVGSAGWCGDFGAVLAGRDRPARRRLARDLVPRRCRRLAPD